MDIAKKGIFGFQYIQCYGSSKRKYIVLMEIKNISIHPMLWFFTSWISVVVKVFIISIHPMLWFFYAEGSINLRKTKFQYIQCYGSSPLQAEYDLIALYFNTSNVMVLLEKSQETYGFHFDFNTSNVMVLQKFITMQGCICSEFQYIQCYGSSFCV